MLQEHSLVSVYVCMCTYICSVHVCEYMYKCIHIHIEARGQPQLCHSLSGLHLANLARLAGHQALGICLSLSPQHWDSKNPTMRSVFMWGLGIKLGFLCLANTLPTQLCPIAILAP